MTDPGSTVAALANHLAVSASDFNWSEVRVNRIGQYREILNEGELETIERLAGAFRRRHNYL